MRRHIYLLSTTIFFFLIEGFCYGSSKHDPINLEKYFPPHNNAVSPSLPRSYQDTSSMKPRLDLSTINAKSLSKLSLEDLYKISKEEAKQIDPKILEHLTYKYALADKMIKEPQRSTALLRLGALGNCVIAQSEYAHRLWKGEGTEKNALEALNWYIEAAQAGDIDSFLFLKEAMTKNKLSSYFGEHIPEEVINRVTNLKSGPI